jgi:hypothetical protein
MTWPPRTIFAVSVLVLLVVVLLAATFLPWYRQLPLSRTVQRVVVACVIMVLLVLIAWVFFVPVYWD